MLLAGVSLIQGAKGERRRAGVGGGDVVALGGSNVGSRWSLGWTTCRRWASEVPAILPGACIALCCLPHWGVYAGHLRCQPSCQEHALLCAICPIGAYTQGIRVASQPPTSTALCPMLARPRRTERCRLVHVMHHPVACTCVRRMWRCRTAQQELRLAWRARANARAQTRWRPALSRPCPSGRTRPRTEVPLAAQVCVCAVCARACVCVCVCACFVFLRVRQL